MSTAATPLTLYLPEQGRVIKSFKNLLEKAGFSIEEENYNFSKIVTPNDNQEINIKIVKSTAAFNAAVTGEADVIVLGRDKCIELCEGDLDTPALKEVGDLDVSKCRFSIVSPDAVTINDIKELEGKNLATSYPKMLQKLLDAAETTATINYYSGQVESRVASGENYAALEIVQSGRSLKDNGLTEDIYITDSSIRFYVPHEISEAKIAQIKAVYNTIMQPKTEVPAETPKAGIIAVVEQQFGTKAGLILT